MILILYIVGALLAALVLGLVMLGHDTAPPYKPSYPPRLSDAEIEAFFLDRAAGLPPDTNNPLWGMSTERIVKTIGTYDDQDDWDRGRFIYGWQTETYYIRVITNADYARVVEFLKPEAHLRSGKEMAVQVLLDTKY